MSKVKIKIAALICLLAVTVAGPSFAATYYFDSVGGNDSNSGTSSNAAWQTLSKINATTFSPGDFVLLKRGSSWSGTMNPKGSGGAGNPITLSDYGTNTAAPLINGNGNTDALVITNQSYWEISDLEVINPGSGTTTERRGIHLCAANSGQINHLYVSNCFVHNVVGRVDTSNGDTVAKRTGGIIVEVMTDSSASTWFNDILIQNCTITSVTNQGIVACGNRSGGSDYPGTSAWNQRNCSNVIIRGNVISDICKNAMSIRYADETCLVEHNLIHDTANATDGNMIATYGCRGTVFQFNEGYHNNGDGLHDGSLYDADLRSQNIVFQYSYSHDNSWGLFAHYASADTAGDAFGNDTHIIVRYNISQNDLGDIIALTGDTGATSSEYIYNNVIFTTNGLAPIFFDDRSDGHTYYVWNNIFYNLSSAASYNFHTYNTKFFDYNLFYGQHVSGEPTTDAHKLTIDPKFLAPGTGGTGGTNDFSTLGGYQLQSNSPCINNALLVTTNLIGITNGAPVDFFGVPVPSGAGTDRGVSEWIVLVTSQLPSLNLLTPAVLPNGATLKAQLNPGNAPTAIWFAFGLATNYGSLTPTNFFAGTNLVTVSNTIAGLLPGTIYHYRATATNSAGTTNTTDATFTTLAVSTPQLAPVLAAGSLRVNFTNMPGATFTVLATTNLSLARSNWTLLGGVTEILPGQFQFSNSVNGASARFYQIRSP
jgi:Right handed beta helix region